LWQVQVKLDEVYISLKAHYDETPETMDRLALKKESNDLEVADLAAEEIEDRREHLQTHLEHRRITDELGPTLELAEVVTHYDRVVILGDPGSGKTTLLRYLALKHTYALWNGRSEAGADLGIARFPILIRIAEYAEDGTWKKKSLSAFLAESYILHDCPSNGLADLLQTELEKGDCLILLDGLDEIVSADERLGVVKQIEDFVRHRISKANRFVITSRKAGYRSAPLAGPFMHYAVQEMDEIQIRRFLERWCQAVENVQTPEISVQERKNVAAREVESIMRAVKASLGVRRLAANPLLLRILALIHRTGAQLPQKRIELYKLATDTLARTWRTAQGVSESALVKEEYLTPLLSELAYWLHMNKPTGIATEREVYEVLGKEWARLNDLHWEADDPIPKITEEVRKFLLAVREHTGLLVERAPRRYGFMHLTFEEYYVARYLVAHSKTRAKLIRHHLHQPRWEEPILLSIGFVGLEYPAEASELVETAILAEGEEAKELGFTSSPYEDLLGRDYLFALRCLGDNIPVRPKLVQRLIERLADERLHRTGSARFQRYEQNLRERLASLGESTGAHLLHRLLIGALHDTDATVRSAAAASLGLLGLASPDAIIGLVATLQDAEVDVCSSAARSLGLLHQSSPEAIVALVVALHHAKSSVRSSAARSLGLLGQTLPDAVVALIAALQDTDANVRSSATASLGLLDRASPQAISALLTALQDADANVRSSAAHSLAQLGQPSPEVISALLAALKDTEASVRSSAAASLGLLGQSTSDVITSLIAVMSDADAGVRLIATQSLGKLAQPSSDAIVALITALHDVDANVRSSAAQYLVQLDHTSPDAIAPLVAALQDADANVRSSAAHSLGLLGQSSPEVIAALVAVLHDAEANVRYYAAQSLGLLGQVSHDAISALSAALHDAEANVRLYAAQSLGLSGHTSPEVTAGLREGLRKAQSGSMRRDAARLLGQVGLADAATLNTLWRGLLDDYDDVRTACTLALAQMGKRLPAITQSLEARFVEAIQDPNFNEPDQVAGRPAYDYAFDGLWSLVVSGEFDKAYSSVPKHGAI
jgi:HEAT repeat protein